MTAKKTASLSVIAASLLAAYFFVREGRAANPPAPQSAPSTTIDLTDPKKAFAAALDALKHDDAKSLRALTYAPDEPSRAAIDALMEYRVAVHQLGKATLAHFGEDGRRLLDDRYFGTGDFSLAFDDKLQIWTDRVNRGKAVVTGDIAVLQTGYSQEYHLRLVNGAWQWDQTSGLNRFGRTIQDQQDSWNVEARSVRTLTATISSGKIKDVEDAKAEWALLRAHNAKPLVPPAILPGNRWSQKAGQPGLSEFQVLVYQQIAELQNCQLQQLSVPGAPDILRPAEGTTQATVNLSKMGLNAIPMLTEALDDATASKTFELDGIMNGPRPPWPVSQIAERLIHHITGRDFAVPPAAKGVTDANDPPAKRLQRSILDWYAANRYKTLAQQKIADLASDFFRNRLDAVEWLVKHPSADAVPDIEKYVERTLTGLGTSENSTSEVELCESLAALAKLGGKPNAPIVKKAAEHVFDEVARNGTGYISDLNFDGCYSSLQYLVGSEEALRSLHAAFDRNQARMDAKTRAAFDYLFKVEDQRAANDAAAATKPKP